MTALFRHFWAFGALLALFLLSGGGCARRPQPPSSSPPAAPPAPVTLVPAAELKKAVPRLPAPFQPVLFLERPGTVTYHVRKGGSLAATLSVRDLSGKDSVRRGLFQGAGQEVQGYPAVPTSMGGGLAVLVGDRFQVEVVSLSPSVGQKRRDAWLDAFDYARLAALARAAR